MQSIEELKEFAAASNYNVRIIVEKKRLWGLWTSATTYILGTEQNFVAALMTIQRDRAAGATAKISRRLSEDPELEQKFGQ